MQKNLCALDAIHARAAGIVNDVRWLASWSIDQLLQTAQMCGPTGGCHETFSPLYMFDKCRSRCPYCAYGAWNDMPRIELTVHEAECEAAAIRAKGCGAAYVLGGTLTAWNKLPTSKLSTQAELAARGLRALGAAGLFPVLEMSPFSRYEFERLGEIAGNEKRGVVFQETYIRETYYAVHGKRDLPFKGLPEQRVTQVSTALAAGWREVGIGALLGLAPDIWYEVACVLAHANILLLDEGAELVTISVPRLTPAPGAAIVRCSDDGFIRAVAIYSLFGRLKFPGRIKVVITGRETPEMRDLLAPMTDIWGIRGSTTPGGYTIRPDAEGGQFSLVDRRTLAEIRLAHAARHLV